MFPVWLHIFCDSFSAPVIYFFIVVVPKATAFDTEIIALRKVQLIFYI